MRNQKTQAFVLVLIIVTAALLFVYRTTHYWQNVERQSVKDLLSTQMAVLAVNVEQSSSEWVNALKTGVANEQIVFRGNVAIGETGSWQIREFKGDRVRGLEFVKQIDWEKLGKQVQWISKLNGQGESVAGLILPDPISGNFLVGVIDNPFRDLTSLYKGSFTSLFIMDKKLFLVGHSKEGYLGTRYDFGASSSQVKSQTESFFELKDGRGLNNFIATFQLRDLNLILGASLAKKFVLIQYVSWLFEVCAFILAAMGILIFWMMRGRQDLSYENTSRPSKQIPFPLIKEPALPKSATLPPDKIGGELLKNLSGALSEQLSGPIEHLMSYFRIVRSKQNGLNDTDLADMERESEKIREVVDSLQSVGRPAAGRKEPVNLEQVLKVMMVEIKSDALKAGIEINANLSPVGDIVANSTQIRSLIHALKKMAFFNVRFEKQKKISLALSSEGNKLYLSITDNGPRRNVGLEDILAEPAYYDQMGLSLPLIHSVVKVYGGTVDIKSDDLSGNSIHIWIPTDGMKNKATKSALQATEIKARYRDIRAQLPEVKIRPPKTVLPGKPEL